MKLRKLLTFLLLLCTALAAGAPTDTLHRADTLPADTIFVRWLADNQLPVYPENRVTLLKSGQEKFNDLFLHIRQARHLKERTVGMARHSVTDLLLDTVIGQARLDAFTVYHPQINDINLRCGMLQNGTIDAAFLPEPYITQAKTEGHNSIYDSRKQNIRLMAFMATAEAATDKRKQEQIKLLLQAYNKATERINHKEQTDSIRRILLQYPVSAATIDSLRIPEYKKAEKAEADQVATAIGFLKRRELIPAQYTGDTLITTSFIP